MVKGGGMSGSLNVGDLSIPSAKDGGGIFGTGVLMSLFKPILRRRLASMIRRVRAYLLGDYE